MTNNKVYKQFLDASKREVFWFDEKGPEVFEIK